jgi:hypothetical protein
MGLLETGWLNPVGEFIPCSPYEHMSYAHKFVEKYKLGGLSSTNDKRADDDRLIGAGWVKISVSAIGKHEWRIWWERTLGTEQIMFLRNYFDNSEIPVCFGSQYHWDQDVNME